MRAKICVLFSGVKRDIWEIEKVHGFVPIGFDRKRKLDFSVISAGVLTASPPFPLL